MEQLIYNDYLISIEKNIKSISCKKLVMRLKNNNIDILLIDVRENTELKSGHIPTSINIPRGILEKRIINLANTFDDEIILYSSNNGRSLLAAYNLKSIGFKNIHSLEGGIVEWYKNGFEISKKDIN